ncbi:MAG: hypothetical protein R3Y29_04515 [bacterium]
MTISSKNNNNNLKLSSIKNNIQDLIKQAKKLGATTEEIYSWFK